MPKLTVDQKKIRAREIVEQIQVLENELEDLFTEPAKSEPRNPQTEAKLPDNFVVNKKVLEAISTKPEAIKKEEIVAVIKEKYGVDLAKQKLQNALSSLKSRGKIDIVEDGVYKFIQN